jgi:hypothetical protein
MEGKVWCVDWIDAPDKIDSIRKCRFLGALQREKNACDKPPLRSLIVLIPINRHDIIVAVATATIPDLAPTLIGKSCCIYRGAYENNGCARLIYFTFVL